MKNKLNAPNWSETGQNKYNLQGTKEKTYIQNILYYAERRQHI